MGWLGKLLLQNWWLKLLALALSFAFWSLVTQGPTVERGLWVTLEVRGVPPGLALTGEIPSPVYLHLRGPQQLMRTLRQEEVQLVLDLSGTAAGNHTLALTSGHVRLPAGIVVVRFIPPEVPLQLVPR